MREARGNNRKQRVVSLSAPYNGNGTNTRIIKPSFTHSGFVVNNSSCSTIGDNCRTYVGNLSWDVTWQDLKDHMRSTGSKVLHADIPVGLDGRSKGYGLVTFATATDAFNAMRMLSESQLNGRKIFIREDRESVTNDNPQISGNSRVYVGNLSWDVTWQDLKDHMRSAGGTVLHADVAMDAADSGRSKGYGLVTFASPSEAEQAIAQLNDSDLKGRPVFIREDREAPAYKGGSSGMTTARQGNAQALSAVNSRFVYVGNLAWDVTDDALVQHMRRAGRVISADVMREASSGRSKGCGLVEYATMEEARHAVLVLHDSEINGRNMFVREDREQTAGHMGDNMMTRPQHQSTAAPFSAEHRLFVGNLAWSVRWQDLKDHFKEAGLVVSHADVARERKGDDSSRSKGFGFVSFQNQADAARAIRELHGSILQDREITVREEN